ncbi:MAG TPA: DUF885 domain-containing protein [Candidatus Saccharimonadales bacterium]|nr:DUF885 domain-containing protein [Candidatus Saccharimonadales bacterium]
MNPVLPAVLALAVVSTVQAADSSAAAALHNIFDREWKARLDDNPLFATSVGVHDHDGELPSVTPASLARRNASARRFLEEVSAIPLSSLGEQDRIDLEIFRSQLEDRIADYRFGDWQIPFTADSGFYTGFARLPFDMPFLTTGDYENYIRRLKAWPRYSGEEIADMREGLKRGMTQPKAVLAGIGDVLSAQIVDDPVKSVFYAPFREFPPGVPDADRPRLEQEGRAAIMDDIVPGYRTLHDFMVNEYVPGARETLGASELPDGRAYYEQQVHHYTTLDLSPSQIHKIGVDEVSRIRREMDAIIDKVGFKGTFPDFLKFLRTDPRFYAKTPEELLKDAAWIAKRMDGKLPSLFGKLPRLPYTVEPVPDDIAPKYTAGRYVPAPVGSTQPGRYWVNTYALETRPLYALEALTLHEAVPGHHLQIALSQELKDLPPFRRYSYISAFGEGWGLYSEWLGLEAGFYTDPYSNFGRLTYEMWRACRLVVDTGIHSMGWTRKQAIDYLAANTALSMHEIETETDRYISWPGQALAYKLGELKIMELRKRAEDALGEHFDVRAFHDAVLANGSVPLGVLQELIDDWIRSQKPDWTPPAAH